MQALIGLERYKEAMKLYEQTSKHYFEELGVTPSEKTGGAVPLIWEAAWAAGTA